MTPDTASSVPTVTIWLTAFDVSPPAAFLGDCRRLLDDDERQRAARSVQAAARDAFVVAHALLRRALSAGSGVPPAAWRFGRGRYGKPAVASPAGAAWPAFSLSHTDGLVGCAISSGGPVGLDVERVRGPVDVGRLARVLSAAEVAEIDALPGPARDGRLYAIWTAKEAYAKAVGTGISDSLRELTVTAAADRPWIGGDASAERWRLHRLDVGPTHAGVVAVGGEASIDVRRLPPADWPAAFA